jgi:hypothetical protein
VRTSTANLRTMLTCVHAMWASPTYLQVLSIVVTDHKWLEIPLFRVGHCAGMSCSKQRKEHTPYLQASKCTTHQTTCCLVFFSCFCVREAALVPVRLNIPGSLDKHRQILSSAPLGTSHLQGLALPMQPDMQPKPQYTQALYLLMLLCHYLSMRRLGCEYDTGRRASTLLN